MGTYSVGLVGESKYQANVLRVRPGQRIRLRLEPDNPHDRHAIAAETETGDTLGYVPKDNFLQAVIHTQKMDVYAEILKVIGEGKNSRGIVLQVETAGTKPNCVYTGSYRRAASKGSTMRTQASPWQRILMQVLKSLFKPARRRR